MLGQPAVAEHPVDGGPRVRLQPGRQLPVGVQQHQEQRRGVDRPVVTPVRDLPEVRQLPAAHLVHDAPRLLVAEGVVLGALGRGERQQRVLGQPGTVGQREERGEQ
ncbi:hypothetical protein GCM10009535_09800 [Streptomyces thermocarboxydovorans]|uniref:Uncharacterized protein n=1 Tax=Streptomyces thermocarboxydovorans TaxID=59298 RepID=A0ABN1HAV7_9ACTN